MAVRAGRLFALDGLGTSGACVHDPVCRCVWRQEEGDAGVWKGGRTISLFESVVVRAGLRTGKCPRTFCMCLYWSGGIGSCDTVRV